MTPRYVRGAFFIRSKHKLYATPLLIVLVVIETTDLVFAFDSIPAILAITHDPFIVFTSNAFAILGLRALYFALANFMDKFRFLKYGLSVILVFIGVKMIITDIFHIPILISLSIIVIVLIISVLASVYIKPAVKEN
jgi:tellurite resistance protein TerC